MESAIANQNARSESEDASRNAQPDMAKALEREQGGKESEKSVRERGIWVWLKRVFGVAGLRLLAPRCLDAAGFIIRR